MSKTPLLRLIKLFLKKIAANMEIAYQIIYLLAGHFVSAFLLQSETMASQKGKHLSWFLLHALIYVSALFFIMLLGIVLFDNWTWGLVWKFILINVFTYGVGGFVMSVVNAEHRERKQYYFLSIGMGFEQLLHASALIYSLTYLLS